MFEKKYQRKNTGPKIEKGSCWEEIMYHKGYRSNGDDGWKDTEIPITHFFVCVAVNDEGASVISWTADDLMYGDNWSLLETEEIRIPKDAKMTGKIGPADIYDIVFKEKCKV